MMQSQFQTSIFSQLPNALNYIALIFIALVMVSVGVWEFHLVLDQYTLYTDPCKKKDGGRNVCI